MINGINAGDSLGFSVSDTGDVNGDGIDDLIIGAVGADLNGQSSAGSSYVVFGKREGFDASLNLTDLNGSNGFVINGINEYDSLGYSVSSAGDVNGDGIDDIIIGARGADPNGQYDAGESYVVFGSSGGFSANFNLSTLNGSNGFQINGIDGNDRSGRSVSSAGDVNGDGIDDLIIGAYGADPNDALFGSGQTYVVFGQREDFDPNFNLADIDGSNGFVINGNLFDYSGYSVSSAGDVNGDGFDDIIIGAYLDSQSSGGTTSTYIVFGKGDGFDPNFNVSDLNGSNGFKFNVSPFAFRESSVSSAGDINDDGYDDLIIGASSVSPNGQTYAGESYVVFGKAEEFDASLNSSDLNGSNGFVINGINEFDESGYSVSTAGDFNNDGFDDLIIGTSGANPNGQDRDDSSYVVFGKREGFDASLNLSDLNGRNGFVINGNDSSGLAGRSVSTAGDVNDDGYDDLIIGAFAADPNGQIGAGSSYVIFGRDFTAAALDVGTLEPSNQLLAGNAVMPAGQNLPFGSTTTADNLFFDQHNAGISPLLVGTDIT